MALHPEFPKSPYEPLLAEHRWFPATEELRTTAYEKLLPPLVAKLRTEVQGWRANNYAGASPTSIALLRWWFENEHLVENADGSLSPFRYFFAQREAVETVVWLHEVRRARDKFDLLRFGRLRREENQGALPAHRVEFFHKLYEPDSVLSRNFLVIAPNGCAGQN